MSNSFSLAEARELHRLCGACVDQHISAGDFDALCQWLRRSSDARRFYVEYLDLHARLGRQYRRVPLPPDFPGTETAMAVATVAAPVVMPAVEPAADPIAASATVSLTEPAAGGPLASSPAELPARKLEFRIPLSWKSLAVSIGIVATLFYGSFVFLAWDLTSSKLGGVAHSFVPEDPSVGSSAETPTRHAVATLSGTQDVEWESGAEPAPKVQHDATLKIRTGTVQLNLKQGTALTIEGPAEWTVVDGNRVKLQHGKLLATVPHQATGFTVETPTSEIVDLGTRFFVEVTTTGVTNVNVLQGLVDATPLNARSATVRLSARQAVRIAPGSRSPESIPYNADVAKSFEQPNLSSESPSSELPTLPPLTKSALLLSDNFHVTQPRHDINPGPGDAAQRQAGLLAPLGYLVTAGDLAASARLGDKSALGSLLLICDPRQDRTCFGPACNFIPPDRSGGQFTLSFTLQPAAQRGRPEEPSTLWFGVQVGANRPQAAMQEPDSRIGFLIQGTGGYRVFDRRTELAAGNLANELSAAELREPLRISISLDAAAFDGVAPAHVVIKVNDKSLFRQLAQGGLYNNYLGFEFLHGRPDVTYRLSDLQIQFQPQERS